MGLTTTQCRLIRGNRGGYHKNLGHAISRHEPYKKMDCTRIRTHWTEILSRPAINLHNSFNMTNSKNRMLFTIILINF